MAQRGSAVKTRHPASRDGHPLGRARNARAILRFVLIMLGLLSLLFWLLTQVPFVAGHIVTPFTSLVAKSTIAALSAVGIDVSSSGNIITLNAFSVQIIPACSGLEMMAILVAAVLAFPARLREKVVGIAIGLIAIYAINILRLVALFLVGFYFRTAFAEAHYYYGQAFLLLATAGLWVLWISRLSKHGLTTCN